MEKLVRNDLLILDDFGLQGFDNHARDALMDIIDERYNRKSTIIATQIPASDWYEIIGGDGTQADYHHFFIMRRFLFKTPVKQLFMLN